jgi:hypothetical protein
MILTIPKDKQVLVSIAFKLLKLELEHKRILQCEGATVVSSHLGGQAMGPLPPTPEHNMLRAFFSAIHHRILFLTPALVHQAYWHCVQEETGQCTMD